jgi:hypothetical protein
MDFVLSQSSGEGLRGAEPFYAFMKTTLKTLLNHCALESFNSTSRKIISMIRTRAANLFRVTLNSGFLCTLAGFLVLVVPAEATTWYVDNTAGGSNNGTSWSNAWTSISAIKVASGGDTVYFSGGSTNSSQTYTVPSGGWSPASTTYQTGQDAAHNGMVIFTGGGGEFLIVNPASNVTFSGYVGNTFDPMPHNPTIVQHMQFGVAGGGSNWDACVYCNNAGQSNNLTLSYIYAPGHLRFVYMGNGLNYSATGLEIDHCYMVKVPPPASNTTNQDDTIYLSGLSGSGYASGAVIHDNFIQSPVNGNQGTAIGDDVFKWGSGFDVYHNHVQLVLNNNYPFGAQYQHSDIFQNNATDVRIYDNWFENVGESVYFHDNFGSASNFSNIRFYNNVITQSFPTTISGVARGMDMEPQDGGASTFSNILIANNTWNMPSLFVYRFIDAAKWTNCHIVNDLYWNCNDSSKSSWDSTASSEVVVDHTMTAKTSDFIAPSTASANFALAAGAPEINAGSSAPSSAFTSDFGGLIRTGWDIGAYAYGSTGPMSPLAPVNLHSTQVPWLGFLVKR